MNIPALKFTIAILFVACAVGAMIAGMIAQIEPEASISKTARWWYIGAGISALVAMITWP